MKFLHDELDIFSSFLLSKLDSHAFQTIQDLVHSAIDFCFFESFLFGAESQRISNGLESSFDLISFVNIKQFEVIPESYRLY